jgi:flagellar biosynthesis protein FlhG
MSASTTVNPDRRRTPCEASIVQPFPSSAEEETRQAKAVAERLKIPFVDPLTARIEQTAVSLLSREMAFQLQALPIRNVEGFLLVAMSSPENPMAVRTIELLTSCKVRPAAAPRSPLFAVLKKVYEENGTVNPVVQPEEERKKKPPFDRPDCSEDRDRPITISIISNKGGVGKTHLAINLAWALAKGGARVLLIDADLGNADISNKLAIFPKHHLMDFLEKNRQMEDLIVHTKFGFDLICGTYGEFKLANMNHAHKTRFMKHFNNVSQEYDVAVFDLGAGIACTVLDFALGVERTVIVTTPQDIISGYACAKAAFSRFKEIEERLEGRLAGYIPRWSFAPLFVINQAGSPEQGVKLFHRLARTANEQINPEESRFRIEPEYLGAIQYDKESMRACEAKKKPLLASLPYVKAAQSIHHMALKFSNTNVSFDPRIKYKHPFRRFMAVLAQKF